MCVKPPSIPAPVIDNKPPAPVKPIDIKPTDTAGVQSLNTARQATLRSKKGAGLGLNISGS